MAIYCHQFFNIDIDIGNINILLQYIAQQYIDLYPWQETSRLEIYLLPRVFPHIFGNKIPKKRPELIDMYMHFTPSAIEDPVAARKHAKNELFNGMERLIILWQLPQKSWGLYP